MPLRRAVCAPCRHDDAAAAAITFAAADADDVAVFFTRCHAASPGMPYRYGHADAILCHISLIAILSPLPVCCRSRHAADNTPLMPLQFRHAIHATLMLDRLAIYAFDVFRHDAALIMLPCR